MLPEALPVLKIFAWV